MFLRAARVRRLTNPYSRRYNEPESPHGKENGRCGIRTTPTGVRSIDHLAYTSGMGGWNPAFKTALALGTLVICLAADRPAVSAAVILALAALQKAKGEHAI